MEQTQTKITNLIILCIVLFATLSLPFKIIQAASLRVSASKIKVSPGQTVTASVVVNTQGKSINNVEAVLRFPPDLMEATSASGGSILSLWVQNPTISNSDGTVSFNGGVPTPGFSGSGTAMTVIFKAKAAGIATLNISGAAVRENDGKGTNILTGSSGVSIEIVEATQTPKSETKSDDQLTKSTQSDKTPPVIVSAVGVLTQQGQSSLEITATDQGLGVDYFVVKTKEGIEERISAIENKGIWITDKATSIPVEYTIIAVDRAGNSSQKVFTITLPSAQNITITDYSRVVNSGELVSIKGLTPSPELAFQVFFRSPSGSVWSYQAQSNEKGEFTFTSEPIVKSGTYQFWLVTKLIDGTEIKTTEISFLVRQTFIERLGDYWNRFVAQISFERILILLLFLLSAVGWYKYYRLKTQRMITKRTVKLDKKQ